MTIRSTTTATATNQGWSSRHSIGVGGLLALITFLVFEIGWAISQVQSSFEAGTDTHTALFLSAEIATETGATETGTEADGAMTAGTVTGTGGITAPGGPGADGTTTTDAEAGDMAIVAGGITTAGISIAGDTNTEATAEAPAWPEAELEARATEEMPGSTEQATINIMDAAEDSTETLISGMDSGDDTGDMVGDGVTPISDDALDAPPEDIEDGTADTGTDPVLGFHGGGDR